MKQIPLFLDPVLKERIWGGRKLNQMYGYDIPSDRTGECWAVSAHPNGQSVIRGGEWQGRTLGELWASCPEWFGATSTGGAFPLLIKILDASEDLSVQVHPDDEYARVHENGELGKTECWYILDCEPEAEIIFGHRATTREQLVRMIESGQWDELLIKVKVHKGDFFYVPSGTIHALGKGTVVLETQQSSDTTYRVYDYDRKDTEGRLRELHLEKAIEVTTVPHTDAHTEPAVALYGDSKVTTLVSNEFFTVKHLIVAGEVELELEDQFLIYSVMDGEGTLQLDGTHYPLQKGDFFILPAGPGTYRFGGKLELMLSRT